MNLTPFPLIRATLAMALLTGRRNGDPVLLITFITSAPIIPSASHGTVHPLVQLRNSRRGQYTTILIKAEVADTVKERSI
jgi:hypothetical protein